MGPAAELDQGSNAREASDARRDGGPAADLSGRLAKRRTIVVIEALYGLRRPEGQPKQPFAIARADGSPLALAGLWEGFKGATGEVTRTLCILTTSSSRLMQTVHDWMSAVLQPADWPLWLGETEDDPATLLRSADEDMLKLWPISAAVDAVRNNGPDLLAPLQTSEAPTPSDAPHGANPAWIRGLGLGWGDSPPTFSRRSFGARLWIRGWRKRRCRLWRKMHPLGNRRVLRGRGGAVGDCLLA